MKWTWKNTVGMGFCLAVALCPNAFALQQAIQRLDGDPSMERLIGPLLDQVLERMNLQNFSYDAANGTITFTHADGTSYHFDNLSLAPDGAASFDAVAYDAQGVVQQQMFNQVVRVLDRNALGFSGQVLEADGRTIDVEGTIVGLGSAPYQAMAQIKTGASLFQVAQVDYTGLGTYVADDGQGVAVPAVALTMVSPVTGDGVTGNVPLPEPVEITVAVVVIVVVVLFVAFTCVALGWWGCD